MPKQTYPCPHLVVDHAGRCEQCLEWLGQEKSSSNYLVGVIVVLLFMAFTTMCIKAGLKNWHPESIYVHSRR